MKSKLTKQGNVRVTFTDDEADTLYLFLSQLGAEDIDAAYSSNGERFNERIQRSKQLTPFSFAVQISDNFVEELEKYL